MKCWLTLLTTLSFFLVVTLKNGVYTHKGQHLTVIEDSSTVSHSYTTKSNPFSSVAGAPKSSGISTWDKTLIGLNSENYVTFDKEIISIFEDQTLIRN